MAVQVPCPKCGALVDRESAEVSSSFCPSCGAMLAGSETAPFLQSTHLITDPLQSSAASQTTAEAQKAARWDRLQLPGFEILGELGRGGMGIVYRARQLRLHREVALKVLPPALAADAHSLQRFRNEAAVAAQLSDSRILPVFDTFETAGVPIIVMPYIAGTDLRRIIRDRIAARRDRPAPPTTNASDDETANPPPWTAGSDRQYLDHVLPLLDQLVDAVTVIHHANVLHRDIKPSNVLVDRRGNLWLADFGLARLGEQAMITAPGAVLGSVPFRSPEQAQGEDDVDARADLFGLGATLYQVLTLELPYGASGARSDDLVPVAPSKRQPLLPRDFDAVILKALQPDRAQRYGTAAEMQEDWRRARQGLLPRARTLGPLRRAARRARRHRWPLALGALLAALLGWVAYGLLRDPTVYRAVRLTSEPPGAQVIFVPLSDFDGQPQPHRAVRAPRNGDATLKIRLPAGNYLVVAALNEQLFHEVYRAVPDFGQPNSPYPQSGWVEEPDGAIGLHPVRLQPTQQVAQGMAHFSGGEFTMGTHDLDDVPPHRRIVDAFYLDTTEVTVGQYRSVMEQLPPALRTDPPPDSHPVTFVSFDNALDYAEQVGKRLPDEPEYEFAATSAGQWKLPWAKETQPIPDWPLGPVGEPAFDQTPTDPPVFGLYSNVAEWTTSWLMSYPRDFTLPPELLAMNPTLRAVRGGPGSVINGAPQRQEWFKGPRARILHQRTAAYRGLGFRCARSYRPRFLDLGAASAP